MHTRDSEGNWISTFSVCWVFSVDLFVAVTDLYGNLWKAVDELPRDRCAQVRTSACGFMELTALDESICGFPADVRALG